VGRSKVEDDKLALARAFLKKAQDRGIEVLLPVDSVVAPALDAARGEVVASDKVPAEQMALDIGPESARGFADRLSRAKTVFWNGPMGVFEKRPFAAGTLAVANAVANCRGLTVSAAATRWRR